jgi:hypothetical protein
MKRFLMTAAILVTTATMSYAGPLGILSPRGTGPVRQIVQSVRESRPLTSAVSQTVGRVQAIAQAAPLRTAITNCIGGFCPAK